MLRDRPIERSLEGQVLLVGGPRDGVHMRPPGGPAIVFAEPAPDGTRWAEVRYVPEMFSTGKELWVIYRHESLTLEQTFEMLLRGYRRPL